MSRKRTIAMILFDDVNGIDVAGPLEAFASVMLDDGSAAYDVVFWAVDEPHVRAESGLGFVADCTMPGRPKADLLIVPGGRGIRQERTLAALAAWLGENSHAFGCIASICTGAYALAEAGLLDGRAVTTHWAFAADLQKRYPAIDVKPDRLFMSDGKIYSSGGVSAGMDLALDLIERDFGAQAAMKVARELVVFLRRTGTQAQFSMPLQMQSMASGKLADIGKWAAHNLHRDLSVEALAARAGLSSRQFSRRFREEFGCPPATYIKRLRLDGARSMLDQGISVFNAARVSGFHSQDGFRRAFEAEFGISPSEYQKRFHPS